jgi:hypothetical protein
LSGLRSNPQLGYSKKPGHYSASKKTPEGDLPGLDAGLKMKAELHFHNFCGLRPFGAFDDLEFYLLSLR